MYLSRDLHLNMDRIFLSSDKKWKLSKCSLAIVRISFLFLSWNTLSKKIMEKKYLFDSKFQVIVPHLSEVKVADT